MCYELNDAFAFLDGVHPDASEVEAHTRSCDRCAARLRQARAARSLWSEAHAPERDDATWARFDRAMADRLSAPPQPRLIWSPWRGLAWAGAMAVFAVALFVAWRFMRPATESGPAAPASAVAETAPMPEVGVGTVLAASESTRSVHVSKATLTLAARAACSVARADVAATVIDLASGAVTFDVEKRALGAVFQVRAADVLVTVHGTRFTVTLGDGDLVDVRVDHGLVGVQRRGEPETLLHASESMRLNGHAPLTAAAAPPLPAPAPAPAPVVVAAAPVPEAVEPAPERVDVVEAPVAHRAPRADPQRVVPVPAPPRELAPSAAPDPAVVVAEPDHVETVIVEKAEPPAKVEVEEQEVGPARAELKAIFTRLDSAPAEAMGQLQGWIHAHRDHAKVNIARYGVGYCLFRLGRKDEATKIFMSVPNPYVHSWDDAKNPPRPQ